MSQIDFCALPSCSKEQVGILRNPATVHSHPILSEKCVHVKNEQLYQNGAVVNGNESCLFSLNTKMNRHEEYFLCTKILNKLE